MAIDENQIVQRFLIVGVVLAAVRPRMPLDRNGPWWAIGGDLSFRFRQLLLAIAAVNLGRLFVSKNQEFSNASGLFSDLLGVVEVVGLTFLSFLTPYLLQTRLYGLIHIHPGKIFYLPLYTAALLSVLGVTLSRLVHPNLWCLKKIANAVSGPPVISVIRTFNRVTTARAHGNGFTMGQSALVIEYWHMGVQIICCVGYACNRHLDAGDRTAWDTFLQAARSIAFLGDWTRVLMHALLLNGMDEMNQLGVFREAEEEENERESFSGNPGSAMILLRSNA